MSAPSYPQINMAEVTAAIQTLYADQLKPYGRILRKRLNEHVHATGLRSPEVDVKLLRSSCESAPWLCVQEEDGGDWSALLQCQPTDFVDVYSPQDAYPAELWRAASVYFESLDDSSMALPGGRYCCAQVLVGRRLPFLVGRSLGEVCHIVQLAISQKKLLGYLNGAVVPYRRSQSMVKEQCAERQRPCSSATRGKTTLATWETLRSCLKEIVGYMSPGTCSIPLSNLKRLFRSRFHVDLSETALGHSKLSELLQDPRLGDVCAVRLQGHGYVVVPVQQPALDLSLRRSTIHLAEMLAPTPVAAGNGSGDARPVSGGRSLRERAKGVKPLCLEDLDLPQPPDGAGDLDPSIPLWSTTPDSARRAQSLPRLLGRTNRSLGYGRQVCVGAKSATPRASPCASKLGTVLGTMATPTGTIRTPTAGYMPPTPSPCRAHPLLRMGCFDEPHGA